MMRLRMPRLGLRNKFVIAVSLSMLLPTSLVSLLAYRLIEDQAAQSIIERINDSLALINSEADSVIGSASGDVVWLSQLRSVSLGAGSGQASRLADMQPMLQSFLLRHDEYNYIIVSGDSGSDLAVRQPGQSVPAHNGSTRQLPAGISDSGMPAVHAPQARANGQWAAVIENGSVTVSVSLDDLLRLVRSESDTLGIRFILKDNNGSRMIDTSRPASSPTDDNAYAILADKHGTGSLRTPDSSTIHWTTSTFTEWTIAAEVPDASTRYASMPTLRSIAFIIVLSLLIGIFVAALLAAKGIRPIRAYREAFDRAAEGDLSFNMSSSSHDEWGQLGASFNRMLQSLHGHAFSDPLTGLPDRRRMIQLIERQLQGSSQGEAEPFAIWFIDVDNFKQMNDTQGHAFGDEVVRQVAIELQKLMPKPNTVARFGGDEFVMLMPGANDLSLRANAAKLQERFDKGIYIRDELMRVQLSVGVAVYPKDGDTLNELIASADLAMYKAKRKGKNNVQFH